MPAPFTGKSGLLLGVTVHEFMLISICKCLCNIMVHGFIGFVVSLVVTKICKSCKQKL